MSDDWEPPRESRAEYPSHFEEYDPNDEHPIARLFRAEWLEERKKFQAINAFIATLTPEDSQLDLFTHAERKTWGLTHTRKRAKEE